MVCDAAISDCAVNLENVVTKVLVICHSLGYDAVDFYIMCLATNRIIGSLIVWAAHQSNLYASKARKLVPDQVISVLSGKYLTAAGVDA